MKPILIAAALLTALTACQRDAPPAMEASGTPASNAGGEAPSSPSRPASGSDAAGSTHSGDVGLATYSGYGDMVLGSSADEANEAWGGELNGRASEPQGCHYLTPRWVANSGELGFMIEGDRFVRYDVGTTKVTAPGGGKVGMSVQELGALYDAMDSAPHKYLQGGRYLSIAASGVAPTTLLFEIDAAGTVTTWRVGVEPQIDYVEGCS